MCHLASCFLASDVCCDSLSKHYPPFPLTRRKAWLFGRSRNWNILMLFHASCGHLHFSSRLSVFVVRSIFFTVHDSAPTSNVCHVANNTLSSSPSFMNLTFYSFCFLLSPWSFFGDNIIGITQSFMMGMHSSIVAGVRLETLITHRWHLVFIFFWECVLFGG